MSVSTICSEGQSGLNATDISVRRLHWSVLFDEKFNRWWAWATYHRKKCPRPSGRSDSKVDN